MGKLSAPANINYPERGAAVQQYRWKAVDSSGVSRSGVYSAASEFEAAAFVRSNYKVSQQKRRDIGVDE